ncbi:MAG: 3'(2'),5'-bisphosphate nucleotidase, partial [Deltaproteobacteria bacterium]|nr:3'(2'),5'-bisphosphate nucleotidase [Deltaproteobacteria bacterium]
YLRLPSAKGYREKVWDHAAGALVIEEAGGKVTDLDGKPLDLTSGRFLGNQRGIIATNGNFHERVLDAAKEVRA